MFTYFISQSVVMEHVGVCNFFSISHLRNVTSTFTPWSGSVSKQLVLIDV